MSYWDNGRENGNYYKRVGAILVHLPPCLRDSKAAGRIHILKLLLIERSEFTLCFVPAAQTGNMLVGEMVWISATPKMKIPEVSKDMQLGCARTLCKASPPTSCTNCTSQWLGPGMSLLAAPTQGP